MSGYRESSFDPNAGQREGAPLHPFNKLQWAGAAIILIGVAMMLVTIAGKFGLAVADTTDLLPIGTTFCALGVVLINSRRAPLSPATKRRRLLILAAVTLVFAIAAAVTIYFQGA